MQTLLIYEKDIQLAEDYEPINVINKLSVSKGNSSTKTSDEDQKRLGNISQ